MLFKQFYDNYLAHFSYMVGCQKTGEAIIVDPARDIRPYLRAAQDENMQIIGVAETHIHADYVSGSRELAEVTNAKLYLSDEGDVNWKYVFAHQYDHYLLKGGDTFMVGNVQFEAVHTPGHTPEHMSYLLTDMGGGASEPMGMFTGDFVFVGSVGRPDLLETAAGVADAADEGARQMFQSVQKFKQLPNYLQIWPAHGAGSACGKGLGAVPSSTVGYEKMSNLMLNINDEAQFVEALLEDQLEPPAYFAIMKQVNKVGPMVLGDFDLPAGQTMSTLMNRLANEAQIVDTRSADQFAEGHVEGTINIPHGNIASWAGWLVNYEKPLYLITPDEHLEDVVRLLAEIGIDNVMGVFDPMEVEAAGINHETYKTATPNEVADMVLQNEVMLIDVRRQTEWDDCHLPNAHHVMLGYLAERARDVVVNDSRPIVVQCRSGARSAIGASILQAMGVKHVINMKGGYNQWRGSGYPVSCQA